MNGTKNSFLLRNLKYNEDLYASTTFTGMNIMNLKKRRNIKSDKYSGNDDAFIWIFKKVPNEIDSYYILNLRYKEPLYAGSWVNLYFFH